MAPAQEKFKNAIRKANSHCCELDLTSTLHWKSEIHMADQILRIIPADPQYVPAPADQQMALALFSSFVAKADRMNIITGDEIRFVDPGEDWQGVTCPVCGADLNDWIQEAINAAYENGFADLTITTPCCNSVGSLNDLIYEPTAGFASFILEAVNPINDLSDMQMQFLKGTMKCEIRKVWAKY